MNEEHELLQKILARTCQNDAMDTAHELLDEYGTLSALLFCPRRIKVTNPKYRQAFEFLMDIQNLIIAGLRDLVHDGPVLSTGLALRDYLFATLAHEPYERFRVLYLNSKNIMIADELLAQGTVDAVSAYPRVVLHRALDLGASAMILVHNHPSGDPAPSRADIAVTQRIARGAIGLDIALHDHVIVTRNGQISMRSEGLI